VGEGQDPNGESGGFTPYQPSDTPQGEPAEEPGGSPPAPPFVPYGGTPEVPSVPYGSALHGASTTPFVAPTTGRRWVGWVVGFGIVIATCGGSVITGLAGFISELGSHSGSDSSPEVVVPEIEIPSFAVPTFDVPSIPTPSVRTEIFANDLRRSQCLIGVGFDPSSDGGISRLEDTDCAGAHNAQVLEVRVLSAREASDYDFTDNDQGNRSCFPLFSRQQKELFRGDKYTLLSFTETANPTGGDKVDCLIVRSDGALYRGFLPR
jgi:hypothetical protein